MKPWAVARLLCHGDGCDAGFEVALADSIQLRDFSQLLARAASGARWMYVLGKPYCPGHAHALAGALRSEDRSPWANAIRTAIVERACLQRVEVIG